MTYIKDNVRYSVEITDEICDAIENSVRGIDHICRENPSFPHAATFRRWLKEHPELRSKYALAKEVQADRIVDETIEIAYDDRKDYKKMIDENGNEVIIIVAESIGRARLKVDTLKWHASKLAPKKYGMKSLEVSADESLLEKIINRL